MTQAGIRPIRLDSLPVHDRDKLVKHMLTTQNKEVSRRVKDRYKMIAERRMDEHRKVNPHRPFHEVMEDGAWAGQRCFILGGGPSLTGFDFSRLEGEGRVIAINRAFMDAPFADVCFFMDGSRTTFYGLTKSNRVTRDSLAKWQAFEGHKVYLNLVGRKLDDVYSVRSLGRMGVSDSLRKGLYHGNNSGVGALGLAVVLRANPIYLLGIDGKFDGGKSHYHDGYVTRRNPESTFQSFVRDFHKVGKMLHRTKFKVINLNPRSGVRCFPFSTIDRVLEDGKS
jgi:hypothetical protein